jgi:CRP-like cAMP-binding protein
VAAPIELLQRVPLFSGLERRDLQQIASSLKERNYSSGDNLTTEGRGGVGFFIIDEGEAVVSVRGDEVRRLGPGDYFGEIAVIAETERTATITADTDVRAYGMTSWEFRPLVEENAKIAWKLLETMGKRLRDAERRAAQVGPH